MAALEGCFDCSFAFHIEKFAWETSSLAQMLVIFWGNFFCHLSVKPGAPTSDASQLAWAEDQSMPNLFNKGCVESLKRNNRPARKSAQSLPALFPLT